MQEVCLLSSPVKWKNKHILRSQIMFTFVRDALDMEFEEELVTVRGKMDEGRLFQSRPIVSSLIMKD